MSKRAENGFFTYFLLAENSGVKARILALWDSTPSIVLLVGVIYSYHLYTFNFIVHTTGSNDSTLRSNDTRCTTFHFIVLFSLPT